MSGAFKIKTNPYPTNKDLKPSFLKESKPPSVPTNLLPTKSESTSTQKTSPIHVPT